MPLVTYTLQDYRDNTLRALRDTTQQYFNNNGQAAGSPASYADLDAWINRALRWRDLWSGGSRAYRFNVPLTQGIDQYDFRALFPNDTVLDMPYLWLIFGGSRYQLSEQTLDFVTKYARGQVGFTNVPAMWCRYGATGLFIATAPSGQYAADFDVVTLSGVLVNAIDPDPLPYPYSGEPVFYKAAQFARQEGQRNDTEAARFQGLANEALNAIEGFRVGMLPTPIGTTGGMR